MERRLLIVLALTVVAASSADGARASLFLTFTGTQARPGDLVFVQTGGRGALRNVPQVRLFLAPADEAAEIANPDETRLIPLGRLRIDDEGNGFLRFIVPDVAPGDYATLMCVYCTQSSVRRKLHPVGPFPGSFVVLSDGDGFSLLPIALAAGSAIALGGAVGWTARPRRSAHEPLGA